MKLRGQITPALLLLITTLFRIERAQCLVLKRCSRAKTATSHTRHLRPHSPLANKKAVFATSSLSKPISVSRTSFLASLVILFPGAVATATSLGEPPLSSPNESEQRAADDGRRNQNRQSSSSMLQESISGLVAGSALTFTKSIVKYPLDTATVRLQLPGSSYSLVRPGELFAGAYRGISVPLLANIPAGAVFFAVKDAAKSFLRESPPVSSSSILQTCLAVGLAQFPYWLVRNPSEVVKTRQQAGIEGFGDGVTALQAYDRVRRDARSRSESERSPDTRSEWSDALQAFYVGYWENILYAYPADVFKFVCYDVLTRGQRNLSPADGAWAGAVSTALAQLVTTPLDVVRNRVMCNEQASSSSSYLSSVVQLAQDEGLTGLFAGAAPRVTKAFLSGAIQFATYEETKLAVLKLFPKR